MKDLWEILGRFLSSGDMPAEVKALARYATRNPDGSVTVNNTGIALAQSAINGLFPSTVASLFAAGEVLRLLAIQNYNGISFFGSGVQPPANATAAFYECLGLCLPDPAFRLSGRTGNFGQYNSILSAAEKSTLNAFLNAPAPVTPSVYLSEVLGIKFRDDGWGGGSCRVAINIYLEYVHTP